MPNGRVGRLRAPAALRWAIGAVLALGLLTVGASAASVPGLRAAMVGGERALRTGRDRLMDPAAAGAAFREAAARFDDARSRLRAPWFRALALVPFVGRTPDALQAVAEAGARVARAGRPWPAAWRPSPAARPLSGRWRGGCRSIPTSGWRAR